MACCLTPPSHYLNQCWLNHQNDGLVQERRNSSANALELRLPCTNISRKSCCIDPMFSFVAGSILEGPDPAGLKPLVEQAMPLLIELLKDPSVAVRDTTAWTVGRICEIIPEAVITEQFLSPLLHALVEGLSAEPRVASNVCWVGNAGHKGTTSPERPPPWNL